MPPRALDLEGPPAGVVGTAGGRAFQGACQHVRCSYLARPVLCSRIALKMSQLWSLDVRKKHNLGIRELPPLLRPSPTCPGGLFLGGQKGFFSLDTSVQGFVEASW